MKLTGMRNKRMWRNSYYQPNKELKFIFFTIFLSVYRTIIFLILMFLVILKSEREIVFDGVLALEMKIETCFVEIVDKGGVGGGRGGLLRSSTPTKKCKCLPPGWEQAVKRQGAERRTPLSPPFESWEGETLVAADRSRCALGVSHGI